MNRAHFCSDVPLEIVVALAATDRTGSVERLLASLKPVMNDEHLHVLVLDNGKTTCLEQVIRDAASESSGARLRVLSSSPRLPLHRARVELSEAVAAASGRDWGASPVVWMVDDDVSFERMAIRGGRMCVENVARLRLQQLRVIAASGAWDMVVSGFTGDAPVRPNAVISCQLMDLNCALRDLRGRPVSSDMPTIRLDGSRYNGDYYYTHRELGTDDCERPFPWHGHTFKRLSVGEYAASMLEASAGIERGQGVFRPLVDVEPDDEPRVERVEAPNRGGNAVFFGLRPMLDHQYPAFAVRNGFSRRSDMIGSALLVRQGYRVGCSNLTLRHDRSDQLVVAPDKMQWEPEFAGVLLARVVMRNMCTRVPMTDELSELARTRAERIRRDAEQVVREADACLATLAAADAPWWAYRPAARAADRVNAMIAGIQETFGNALRTDVLGADDVNALVEAVERQRTAFIFTERVA